MTANPNAPQAFSAPVTYEQLRALLQVELPQLAAGQQRIAQVILADPEATAFRTISDTARAAQVSESSLVRFAERFGLGGYPAITELCRQQLAERTQLVRRFEQAQQVGDTGDLLLSAAASDQQNISQTMAQVTTKTWEQAVEALSRAKAVHIAGFRKCFAVSYLLAYLLRLVRRDVHLLAQETSSLADELRELEGGDAFVAISIHRYTLDTLRALRFARQRGLTTIVLTDNAASPLYPLGDVVFLVETGSVTVLRSVAAMTSLVQALATGVAVQLGTETRNDLLHDEELLDLFDTYYADRGTTAKPRPGQAGGR